MSKVMKLLTRGACAVSGVLLHVAIFAAPVSAQQNNGNIQWCRLPEHKPKAPGVGVAVAVPPIYSVLLVTKGLTN